MWIEYVRQGVSKQAWGGAGKSSQRTFLCHIALIVRNV